MVDLEGLGDAFLYKSLLIESFLPKELEPSLPVPARLF